MNKSESRRVAIDISPIVYETGVSRYTKNLVKNLLQLDSKNKYILYGNSLRQFTDLKKHSHDFKGKFETKFFPLPPTLAEILWNQIHLLPIEALVGKVDVFHSSDWYQPPSRSKKVTTIHDLSPILFPKLTHPKIVSAHKKRLHWVKKEVDKVIVPSNAVKNDLVKFGFEREKIIVIYEAAESKFKPMESESINIVKEKLGINGEYLLSIGVGERKNTKRIIEAFNSINLDLKLVFVGKKNGKFAENKNIIFTGHARDEDLPALYSGAKCLVYPSLYEGFGLPILEAFACKCPVVTSDVGSLAEVAAGAAILVDPMSSDSIAKGIQKCIKSTRSMVQKGDRRLKDFSWRKTAQETLNIYNSI